MRYMVEGMKYVRIMQHNNIASAKSTTNSHSLKHVNMVNVVKRLQCG